MVPTQKAKRILFCLGLSLPLIALIGMTWLVHKADGRFNNSFNWVVQNYKIMDLVEQTQTHIVDAEANRRGYLLTGREDYLEPYQSAMSAVHDNITELKQLTRNDPDQEANIIMLEQLVAEELAFDPKTAFANGQNPANASVMEVTLRGKKTIEDFRRVLYSAREEQERVLGRHEQKAGDELISSQLTSLLLILAVAVALIFIVVILVRLEKLQQFVTICAWTGRVRFQGEWLRLDEYLKKEFGLAVSHSLSQEAADKMRAEIEELNRAENPPAEPPKK